MVSWGSDGLPQSPRWLARASWGPVGPPAVRPILPLFIRAARNAFGCPVKPRGLSTPPGVCHGAFGARVAHSGFLWLVWTSWCSLGSRGVDSGSLGSRGARSVLPGDCPGSCELPAARSRFVGVARAPCGSFGPRLACSGFSGHCCRRLDSPGADCESFEPHGALSALVVPVWFCLAPAGVCWSTADSQGCPEPRRDARVGASGTRRSPGVIGMPGGPWRGPGTPVTWRVQLGPPGRPRGVSGPRGHPRAQGLKPCAPTTMERARSGLLWLLRTPLWHVRTSWGPFGPLGASWGSFVGYSQGLL